MNRRAFLQQILSVTNQKAIPLTTTSLDPWQPTAENPWDDSAVNHLYHRLGFSATYAEITSEKLSSPSAIIKALMDDHLVTDKMPPPPDGWEEWLIVPPYQGPIHDLRQHEDDIYHTAKTDIRCQWTVMMTEHDLQLREKLTLFWHNHFVVEEVKIYHTQMMYRYFEYLRKNAWGNFKQMVKDITIMPGMLVYLSGIWSEKNALNENYGREVMELFTMGRIDRYGNENYTQQDVRDVASAVTGWRFRFEEPGPNVLPPYFANYYFDFETKTSPFGAPAKIYGLDTAKQYALFPVDLEKIETDIIELIFEKRASQIAWFIAKKIYRAFVYEDASTPQAETIIEQLANILLANNWEMKPMLLQLFQSEHFFDLNFRGAAIKYPYEYMCGMMRKFDIPISNYQAGNFWSLGMDTDQWLCSPPNVKGWPGYHAWLNSATLPKRNNDFAKEIIINKALPGRPLNPRNGFNFDWIHFDDDALIIWAKQFPDFNGDLKLFALEITGFLCAIMPDDPAIDLIVNSSGILHTYEWSVLTDSVKAGPLRQMLFSILQLPHFQLC